MKKKAAGRADGKNKIGKNEVRKRAAVMNLTWLTVWLLSFAGMAVFYELKCQAVIGAVYQSNPSAGILVTHHMFMAKINHENLISAASAVYESGYTEQGIFRLMWYAGGKGFLLAGIVILAVMGFISWWYIKKIGGSDVYARLESCEMQDVRKLYGAPNCISIDYGSVFDRIKTEEGIKERLLTYYPEMKGIQISGKNSSVAKLLFTPEATKQLLSYLGWGEKGSDNYNEHLVSLNGFISGKLIVIEKVVPRKEPERIDCFLDLPNSCSLVGIAYVHPFELLSEISVNDVPLNVGQQYINRELVTLIVNSQKKQIVAYRNLDFEQIDVEFLVKNTFELHNFINMENCKNI